MLIKAQEKPEDGNTYIYQPAESAAAIQYQLWPAAPGYRRIAEYFFEYLAEKLKLSENKWARCEISR